MLFFTSSEPPSKKALVTGNSKYTQNPLKKCTEDAKNVQATLTEIGFKVTCEINLEGKEMDEKIEDFIKSILPGDYVIFYFAGHGRQWGDQNYLVACDYMHDIVNDETTLEMYAINVQKKLNKMIEKEPHVVIFLLDCCRQYWWPQIIQGGTTQSNTNASKRNTSPTQTIIAFACGPGEEVSGNEIFTKYLLKHIKKPNSDIETVLCGVTGDVGKETKGKQKPKRTSSLTEKICIS
jgi:uncharacterized caspase-like protein